MILAIFLAFVATTAMTQATQPVLDASRLMVTAPASLVAFKTSDVKGFPMRMAWSSDGRELHLRIVQRDRWGNELDRHYVVAIGDRTLLAADSEPAWAAEYWLWKSALECPGTPAFRIAVETRVDRKSATGAGAGGSLAQFGGDPYGAGSDLGPQGQAVLQGAQQSQNVTTSTLRLHGQVVSEFVNTGILPGLMYGWAPQGMEMVAYANQKRVLVIMDGHGRRHTVAGTKSVILPAWTADGRTLAWIEQKGRDAFTVKIAQVSPK